VGSAMETGSNGRHAGFSLVELMIALALGAVILLGVTQLFSSGSRTVSQVENIGRALEGGFYAIDTLTADIRLAGYWGESSQISADGDVFRSGEIPSSPPVSPFPTGGAAPGPCVGTGEYVLAGSAPYDTLESRAKAELAWGMEFPITGGFATTGNIPCASDAPLGINDQQFLAIKRASTCSAIGGFCDGIVDNHFYLQTNGCYDTSQSLTGGELRLYAVTGSNYLDASKLSYKKYSTTLPCTDPAPIYKYISRIYYVDDSQRLVRMQLAGTDYVSEAIVSNVELLRIEWGRDTDGDGAVDRFDTTGTAVGSPAWSIQWQDVIAARVWLVVRSPEKLVGFEDDNQYLVAGEAFSPDANYINHPRIVFSRLIELPNIAGRRR